VERMQKRLRTPGLHTNEHDSRMDLFQGVNSGFLQVVAKTFLKVTNNGYIFLLQTRKH